MIGVIVWWNPRWLMICKRRYIHGQSERDVTQFTITSWHGNALCIIGPLWRDVRSQMDSLAKGQQCGALVLSLLLAWANWHRQSSYRWFEMTCNGERNCVMSANHQPINMIWRVWRQKQVFQTWISNRIPQNIVGRNYLAMPVMPVFWHQSPPICYGCYIF